MLHSFSILVLFGLPSLALAQTRQFINPGPKPPGYSHAVAVSGGRTVYISGQIALNAAGSVVGVGDFKAQARQVFENLKTLLAASQASFADVVKINYYVVGLDAERLRMIREIRDEYLPADNRPASTLVGVQALVRPDLLLEVEAVVVTR